MPVSTDTTVNIEGGGDFHPRHRFGGTGEPSGASHYGRFSQKFIGFLDFEFF